VEGLKRAITNKRGFTTSREILIVGKDSRRERSSSTCRKAVKTVWRYLAMVVHVVLEYNRLQLKPVVGLEQNLTAFPC